MPLPVSLLIARRLRLRAPGERSASAGITVGVVGVALSLCVMMAAVAVVTGFKLRIVEKVRGINADIALTAPEGEYLRLDEETRAIAARTIPGAKLTAVTARTGILKTADAYEGLNFRGLGAEADTAFLAGSLVSGAVKPLMHEGADSILAVSNPIIISAATASALDLAPGDRVDAFFVTDGAVRPRRFTVTGIFDTHFTVYDKGTAYVSAEDLPLAGEPQEGACTSIEITGLPLGDVEEAARQLTAELMEAAALRRIEVLPDVTTVHRSAEMYFNWLSLLDTNVVVILVLMGLVAGFTLVSCLFVIILRRVTMIGLLKALGADDRTVGNIFVALTARVIALGLIIGNALALTLLLLQQKLHLLRLDPRNYYLDYVPVHLDPAAILLLNAGVAVAACLIILGPSRAVMRVSPARTMRYD